MRGFIGSQPGPINCCAPALAGTFRVVLTRDTFHLLAHRARNLEHVAVDTI